MRTYLCAIRAARASFVVSLRSRHTSISRPFEFDSVHANSKLELASTALANDNTLELKLWLKMRVEQCVVRAMKAMQQ